MTTYQPKSFDLGSPAFVADPYPVYAQLRSLGGPALIPMPGMEGEWWLFTHYDDVTGLLKEAHTSKDVSQFVPVEEQTPLDQTMLFKDPPDHTRLRSLASQAFTPARIRELEPRIAQIADTLLDQLQSKHEMEFMREFALPLPIIVIAELLGVPASDREHFRQWSNTIIGGADSVQITAEAILQQANAMTLISQYFMDLIEQRRRAPQADLISAMIKARDAQDRLSEQELVGMCILLLIAGHETTVNLLGNGLLALLRHPDQLQRLRQHPDLMPSAVEELLRFDGPVQRATFRITTDTINYGGVTITRGQLVSAVLGAANRDPAHFPEPDQLDIARQANRHVAFGLGLHFCLGAPLARTEARIGFARLLDRLPHLELTEAEPVWNNNTFIRGLRALHVRYATR